MPGAAYVRVPPETPCFRQLCVLRWHRWLRCALTQHVVPARQDASHGAQVDRGRLGSATKGAGAFFTPASVARYVTDWAVRATHERILEPSCGEASFLLAAVDRLTELRGTGDTDQLAALDGIELHEDSARAARGLLRSAGVDANVAVGDFFVLTQPVRTT